MKQAANGSVTLMVLVITTAMAAYVFTLWRSSIYAADCAYKRQQYEQRWRATQALLDYGVQLARHNFAALTQSKQTTPQLLRADRWPVDGRRNYRGELQIMPSKKSVELKASLYTEQNIVCRLQCRLEQQITQDKPAPVFVVNDWHDAA